MQLERSAEVNVGYQPKPEGVGFHPDFRGNVRYKFIALPEDPDGQVRATMNLVRRYLRNDAQHPFFRQHAQKIADANPGDPIQAVWTHIKRDLKFQQDEDSAQRFEIGDARKPDIIEVVIRPIDQALLIELTGSGFEDCDGYELYAGCILTALGIPVSLVTIAADSEDLSRYSHVYLAVYPNGYSKSPRIALDFSHGDYPGWEARNLGRLKEWPIKVTMSEVFWDSVIPVGLLTGAYFGLKYLESQRRAA